ncbi:hypothetical protein LUZ61_018282 [Rhynchospora tenuis]|uniref:Citrate transporter-like domain-containing protein n=1 Tax=Rhynchospora tenuis TaxID=198213 RepID=A0AAD6ELT3_9POAL|nr:hypothetical protein LUZ61_018282 [Rhynchospora tenuis]
MLAMEPTTKVVLGSIAFGIFWVLAVFPAVPFLPIGRTAGSLLGAMLMVLLRVLSADEAYASINLPILGLLFGTMVVSVYLERADMFKYLGKLLSWKSQGGKDLLCRICLVSAVASALFTNDTCCVVLTEFILKIARQNNLPPKPFLLALASSANIGSAATPIGNPQNLVIAVQSKISFGQFLFGVLPAMLIGIVINAGILLCYFWGDLSGDKYHYKEVDISPQPEVVEEEDVTGHRFSPATMSHHPCSSSGSLMDCISSTCILANEQEDTDNRPVSGAHGESKESTGLVKRNVKSSSRLVNCTNEASFHHIPDEEATMERWQRLLWNGCVYAVTLAMLIALWAGLNMSWSAITAALALIVLDFKDAGPCLEKVSYGLLLFFCGMFVTVDGFNKTGVPSAFWDFMEPYSQINTFSGMLVLAFVILFLSNVASNVPTVLLLGAQVAASAAQISPSEETRAWLFLAWVSTVAGNLSLLGSAANLIVCEQARRSVHYGYNLSFLSHLIFGLPSTIIITIIGLFFISTN